MSKCWNGFGAAGLGLLLLFATTADGRVSFFQPPTYAGAGFSLFVGDFNGDGKPDILADGGTLNLGKGDGTFTLGTPVSGKPLAVADFNGDGKLDILEQGTGTLLVLLGNGDGTFQPAISTASGASLMSATSVDLNGDGKADVIGVFGSSLLVYISRGDGTFAPGVSYNLGVTVLNSPGLSQGDLNSDGKTDVVLSIAGDNVTGVEMVLLGNGDGTFQAPISSPGVYGPFGTPAVGDFNGDGKLDLVLSGSCSGCGATVDVYILMGNGDGTFQAPTVAFPGGGMLAAVDLNGDGKLDLVLQIDDGREAQIYLGIGDGTFSDTSNYVLSWPDALGGAGPLGIAIADFNLDGKLDIAAGNSVLLSNGDGTFQGIQLGVIPDYLNAAAVGSFIKNMPPGAAALSNQQIGSTYFYNVYILSNNGTGALSLTHTYPLQQPGNTIVTADFNGDGNLDLMVFGTDPTTQQWSYSVLVGNGDGSFQPPVFYPQSQTGTASSVVVADFNHDGKPDIASVGTGVGVAVLLGNGDGTFAAPAYYFDNGASSLVTADFNGDGKLDIAAGGTIVSTSQTALLFGNGDGTFQPAVFPASLNGFIAEFTVDLNNDGKPDLVSSYQVALGNGDGTFTWVPTLLGASASFNALTDLDGDGKPDGFVTYFGASSHPLQTGVLLGNGDGTFGPLINVPTSGLLPSRPLLMIADMNGDGLPDLIFPWQFGINALGVMLNTTQVGPPPPDFQIVASGLSPTPVIGGSSATSTITIAPLHGFSGTVALSCTGLPSGVGCSFNPTSLAAGSGTSTLTVTTASSLQAGSYTVIANGVSGTLSRIAALALTVESGPTPDFQISATATTPATVAPGTSATSTVTISPVNGFNSAVALTCSSVVSGVTCSLNPTSVTPSGAGATSTLTIHTSAATALGAYSITVSGISGSNIHSTGVTLTVQVPSDFTLGAASGSATSQTISAGQTATFSLAFAPTGSFTGTLNLSCSIAPVVTPAPTCSLSSSSVQISGSGGASVAVAVGTTAPVTTSAVPHVFPPPTLPLAWTLTLLTSGWLFVRTRKRLPSLAASLIVLTLASSVGCGGSSSTHTTPGTTKGTYTATITATSGNLSHNMPLTVVVQ